MKSPSLKVWEVRSRIFLSPTRLMKWHRVSMTQTGLTLPNRSLTDSKCKLDNMKIRSIFTLIFLVLCVFPGIRAQQELTFDDQFNGTYSARGFGPARWVDGGKGYTTLENSTGNKGRDIVRYESATGARSILVKSSELIPEGKT